MKSMKREEEMEELSAKLTVASMILSERDPAKRGGLVGYHTNWGVYRYAYYARGRIHSFAREELDKLVGYEDLHLYKNKLPDDDLPKEVVEHAILNGYDPSEEELFCVPTVQGNGSELGDIVDQARSLTKLQEDEVLGAISIAHDIISGTVNLDGYIKEVEGQRDEWANCANELYNTLMYYCKDNEDAMADLQIITRHHLVKHDEESKT